MNWCGERGSSGTGGMNYDPIIYISDEYCNIGLWPILTGRDSCTSIILLCEPKIEANCISVLW